MSQKVIINIGVSGSGKSTWTKDYINKNPKTVRINRDDLRIVLKGTLDGYYDQDKDLLNSTEHLINRLEDSILVHSTSRGLDVVIDNTNLKPAYVERWVKIIKCLSGEPEVFFNIFKENNLDILKKRVNIRDAPLGWDKLKYIDKQVSSLKSIIDYVEKNYKNQIING